MSICNSLISEMFVRGIHLLDGQMVVIDLFFHRFYIVRVWHVILEMPKLYQKIVLFNICLTISVGIVLVFSLFYVVTFLNDFFS